MVVVIRKRRRKRRGRGKRRGGRGGRGGEEEEEEEGKGRRRRKNTSTETKWSLVNLCKIMCSQIFLWGCCLNFSWGNTNKPHLFSKRGWASHAAVRITPTKVSHVPHEPSLNSTKECEWTQSGKLLLRVITAALV